MGRRYDGLVSTALIAAATYPDAINIAGRPDHTIKEGSIMADLVGADGVGFVNGGRPLCGFCNTPWSDDMIRVFDVDATHGPDSYDMGPEDETATIDITCSTCDRLIYRKEYRA